MSVEPERTPRALIMMNMNAETNSIVQPMAFSHAVASSDVRALNSPNDCGRDAA